MKHIHNIVLILFSAVMVGCVGEDLSEIKQAGPDAALNIGNKSAEAVDLGLSVKWADMNLGSNSVFSLGGQYDLRNKDGSYPSQITIINTAYDRARTMWGSPWRMPSRSEWSELKTNCTWSYATKEGPDGYAINVIEAKGPNGNSIYFPINMNNLSTTSWKYWTGTPYDGYQEYYYYGISRSGYSISIKDYTDTYWGYSSIPRNYIRPVQDY